MGKFIRFGVSLDKELLESFDELLVAKGYDNRSEAIRDLIRGALAENSWGKEDTCAGVLTLVYDHHKFDLARRLMHIQHEEHDIIVTTMHIHVDHDNCLEILVLKGDSGRVPGLAQRLISCKGVKYGVFNPAPNGGEIV